MGSPEADPEAGTGVETDWGGGGGGGRGGGGGGGGGAGWGEMRREEPAGAYSYGVTSRQQGVLYGLAGSSSRDPGPQQCKPENLPTAHSRRSINAPG